MEVTIKHSDGRNEVINCTAAHAMYLFIEGFDVWARDAQWSRINKRAHQLDMFMSCEPVEIDPLWDSILVMEFAKPTKRIDSMPRLWDGGWDMDDSVPDMAQRLSDAFSEDVYDFIEEMNIMGMIDAQPEDDAPPMWGSWCMN